MLLPILVRRLILATTSVSEITMRAREGALLPGWDGIVRSDVTDAHVPLGTSGWELGTSKDPREKAQSDIRSRTKDPLGLDQKTTTFVAVTSRLWRGVAIVTVLSDSSTSTASPLRTQRLMPVRNSCQRMRSG